MRKLTSLVMAITLAMGAANIVHAAADSVTPPSDADKPMMHMTPRHGGPHDMFKGLKLTDAQKEQMRTIMKESHKDMPRPSLEERRALHSLVASDSFDREKAEAQAEKMAANGKERALSMLETQNKMYNVLTPEQKKEYNAKFEKHLTEKPQHEMPPAEPDAK